jgi:NhaP-type Na+/H+ or K+/H+ antiporter
VPECNLITDIINLANIDPHVFLVLFLPPLLFESAAFGLDMGIFRKQVGPHPDPDPDMGRWA